MEGGERGPGNKNVKQVMQNPLQENILLMLCFHSVCVCLCVEKLTRAKTV